MADKNYVAQSIKGTITIPTSDTVLAGTATLGEVNGITHTIILTTPAMEDTDSTLMQIANSNGAVFFTSGTKAESSTSVIGSQVAVVPGDKIIMTAEGTQSAAAAIVYDIRMLI